MNDYLDNYRCDDILYFYLNNGSHFVMFFKHEYKNLACQ